MQMETCGVAPALETFPWLMPRSRIQVEREKNVVLKSSRVEKNRFTFSFDSEFESVEFRSAWLVVPLVRSALVLTTVVLAKDYLVDYDEISINTKETIKESSSSAVLVYINCLSPDTIAWIFDLLEN
ncbi:protein snakeskin isoform X1 [Vespula squamosa]|uniref:Protein snakeskin isoform X1 n=1 Tax=Vespula squamosa TaxID=30214 RepID=A0ABD2BM65_VESSQ